MARILIVDDQKNFRRSLTIAVEDWGHDVSEAANGEEAIKEVEREIFDLVVTDLVMEPIDGLVLLKRIRVVSPSTEILLMSAHGSIPKAVAVIKSGAADFIIKPFSMEQFEQTINRLVEQSKLKRTVKRLQKVLADKYVTEEMIAVSAGMREVMRQASLVADWSVPVLIQGESGVGKELVAMAVHHLSYRIEKTFIPVNCGAFSETLLDSELFGHCKGAFTGAHTNKRGLIEEADGGTLLLDEIGEAPPALQVRLLRFLDNGKFRRIGEVIERESNVRIIAATNKDVEEMIKTGEFREDLYYRLSVAIIKIPPLRERRDDIVVLIQRFMQKYGEAMNNKDVRIHPEVMAKFQDYQWPGNVRELENAIEHALIVSGGEEVRMEHISPKFQRNGQVQAESLMSSNKPLSEIEKQYILRVLDNCKGNKKKAAEVLEISRTTLISRLKQYAQSSDSN